ncbi:ankyrin repeat and sterile alpha motif domain-containing protein 1B isoform X5 [Neoarius graeffei]|nr:ankyrin repeat and sterile alpha motif domain-containing protein 1B isoform X5 [Neoarius graeffei]
MDVVRLLLDSGIDVNIRDCHGKTALDILREHPAQKSQQITALIQEFMMAENDKRQVADEPIRQCPVPAPRTSKPSPAASPSLRHKNEPVTGELSKLLNDIKMCRDRDYSFEELCQAISSHSQSMESFCSGTLSDEDRNTTHISKWPTPPLPTAMEEEEKACGPSGLWEALTPCNGCRNLGFSQDSKHCVEIIQSSSLDVFSPEEEDNPYESVTTAVTRKPCSLDIHLLNACPRNGHSLDVSTADVEQRNHGDDYSSLTPDCSPPSPGTALKNIERVIRPQPKQRTSLSSSQDVQRTVPSHSGEPSEVSSSLGYASFSTSPPASPLISPANYSTGSAEDCPLADEVVEQRETTLKDDRRESRVPEQFAGLLHGSSPACESPDNPYQLYSKVRKDPSQRHSNLLLAPNHAVPFPASKTQKEPKPQVVYRTIFHTRVNQNPSVQGKNEVNRSGEGGNNSAGCYEERACTLGRMRSGVSKNVPELQLSRSLSKSDSNLVVASPIEEEKRNSRGQNSPTRLERTPSFTAEWEEIDKIMSSIGAGIGTELKENDEDRTVLWMELSLQLWHSMEVFLRCNYGYCSLLFTATVTVRKEETGSLGVLRREVYLRTASRWISADRDISRIYKSIFLSFPLPLLLSPPLSSPLSLLFSPLLSSPLLSSPLLSSLLTFPSSPLFVLPSPLFSLLSSPLFLLYFPLLSSPLLSSPLSLVSPPLLSSLLTFPYSPLLSPYFPLLTSLLTSPPFFSSLLLSPYFSLLSSLLPLLYSPLFSLLTFLSSLLLSLYFLSSLLTFPSSPLSLLSPPLFSSLLTFPSFPVLSSPLSLLSPPFLSSLLLSLYFLSSLLTFLSSPLLSSLLTSSPLLSSPLLSSPLLSSPLSLLSPPFLSSLLLSLYFLSSLLTFLSSPLLSSPLSLLPLLSSPLFSSLLTFPSFPVLSSPLSLLSSPLFSSLLTLLSSLLLSSPLFSSLLTSLSSLLLSPYFPLLSSLLLSPYFPLLSSLLTFLSSPLSLLSSPPYSPLLSSPLLSSPLLSPYFFSSPLLLFLLSSPLLSSSILHSFPFPLPQVSSLFLSCNGYSLDFPLFEMIIYPTIIPNAF